MHSQVAREKDGAIVATDHSGRPGIFASSPSPPVLALLLVIHPPLFCPPKTYEQYVGSLSRARKEKRGRESEDKERV